MDLIETSLSLPAFTQPLTRRNKIECKPELVIGKLQKFYQNTPEIDNLMPYLTGTAPISLRIIDWFVTKESRRNFTQYMLNSQKFVVFLSYKGQLRAYSKKYFDPNCRRERIMFEIPGKEPFLTTIGKLNFFKWAYECKVINYIEENIETLREGYNAYLRDNNIQLKRTDTTRTTSSLSSADSQNNVSLGTGTSSLASTASAASASTASALSTSYSVASATGSQISLTPLGNINPNRSTRRRRSKQIPSSLQQLQIQNDNKQIVLSFN
jgi:hypothetical protein